MVLRTNRTGKLIAFKLTKQSSLKKQVGRRKLNSEKS